MTAHDERENDVGWRRVASELKARPPEAPGAFARERIAQSLQRGIESKRGARRMTLHRAMPIALAGAVVAAGAAALLVAWRMRSSTPGAEGTARIAVVSFEGSGGAAAEIAQGGELRTAPGLVASTQVAGARLMADGASAMRLSSLDPHDVRVSLLSGSVRVAFHPSSEGDRVTIRTRDADVVVVGTVFRVEATPDATRVSVTEGRVRVTDRSGRRQDATPGHDVLVRDGAMSALAPGAGAERPRIGAANSTPVAPAIAPTAPSTESQPRVAAPSVSPTGTRTRSSDSGSSRSAVSLAVQREDEPQSPAPDPRARLSAARALLERGQHGPARSELRSIGSSSGPMGIRIEAWTLLAESHQSTGDSRTAVGLYDRAAALGHGSAAGANARFAQARLLDRRLGDSAGARAAYRRYLVEAPRGALRRSAIEALCRLGDAEACTSRAETEETP